MLPQLRQGHLKHVGSRKKADQHDVDTHSNTIFLMWWIIYLFSLKGSKILFYFWYFCSSYCIVIIFANRRQPCGHLNCSENPSFSIFTFPFENNVDNSKPSNSLLYHPLHIDKYYWFLVIIYSTNTYKQRLTWHSYGFALRWNINFSIYKKTIYRNEWL